MVSIAPENEFLYFQYKAELALPVMIRIQREQETALTPFLQQHSFTLIDTKAREALEDQYPDHYRVLTVTWAGPQVARALGVASQHSHTREDQVVSAGPGYQVYRFPGHGLMVFSRVSPHWELGVHQEFGTELENQATCRVILHRFLALALVPLGFCGFWGLLTEGGLVVMNRGSALGEAVFIHRVGRRLLTRERVHPLHSRFAFIRQGEGKRGSRRIMRVEELMGLLSTQCVFIGSTGLDAITQGMIQDLSLRYQGAVVSGLPQPSAKQLAV